MNDHTVTISNFDKRLLIEQVRYIESEHRLACDAEEVSPDLFVHSDFEERLWQRARGLVDQHGLSPALRRAARLSTGNMEKPDSCSCATYLSIVG